MQDKRRNKRIWINDFTVGTESFLSNQVKGVCMPCGPLVESQNIYFTFF